jgi:hypothetical protein
LAGIIEILLDDLFGINKTLLSFSPFNTSDLTDKYQTENLYHRNLNYCFSFLYFMCNWFSCENTLLVNIKQ